MKQSYYEIDCTAFMCFFQIKINDVEVFSLNVDGQTTADIPINHGILERGTQEIEVKVFPLLEKKELHKAAFVKYKIVEYDVSTGKFELISQLEGHRTLPVIEGIPFMAHKSKFISNVSYKIEAWQKSQNLKDLKIDVREILIVEYNKIIKDISSGNYSNYIKKNEISEKNTAIAMYLNENEAKNRQTNLIESLKSGLEAIPVSNDVIVEYSAYGKLACLKTINGESVLRFINKETNEELIIPITFHIPEGKTEFEVI